MALGGLGVEKKGKATELSFKGAVLGPSSKACARAGLRVGVAGRDGTSNESSESSQTGKGIFNGTDARLGFDFCLYDLGTGMGLALDGEDPEPASSCCRRRASLPDGEEARFGMVGGR